MKHKLQAIVSAPLLISVGWFFTKLSEKYAESLADFDVDFDFE